MIPEADMMELILRERAAVVAYLNAIIRDVHEAEDAYQEISLTAIKKREDIRDGEHLKNWLRQAARFRGLMILRTRRRSKLVFDSDVLDGLQECSDGCTEDRMHDMRSNLRKCVGELSPDAREIVRLRYVENVRGAALAEVIGKPVNTVMVALSRINRRLAKCVRIKLALEAAT